MKRRRFCGALFALGLSHVASRAQNRLAVEDDDVDVDYRNGRYFAELSVPLPAGPAVALAALTDFERMPAFMPGLVSSRILSRTGNVWRIAQTGAATFGPFTLRFDSERRVELTADGRLISLALTGSARYLRSEVRFVTRAGVQSLNYRLEMEPDQWLPAGVGVPFLRHEVADQFNALLREMARRAALEAQGAKKSPL